MLRKKEPSRFYNVKAITFITITLALLTSVTVFGAIDSRHGFIASFTELLGFQNDPLPVSAQRFDPTPTFTATFTPTPLNYSIHVGIPNMSAGGGGDIEIPVNVNDSLDNLNITAFALALEVTGSVAAPDANPVITSGTMSSGWMITTFPANLYGSVIVEGYSTSSTPLSGTGVLVKLKYHTGSTGITSMCLGDMQDTSLVPHIGMGWNNGAVSGAGYRACGFLYVATPTPTASPAAATPTNTATGTPTNTATSTATATPAISISGTVTYDNAIGSPAPRYVSNVTVQSTVGSPGVSSITDPPGTTAGYYLLAGFGTGITYTITPSKSGGVVGAINSFDAAKIAAHVAGSGTLTGNPLIVADVSNNGSVTSFDAAYIAKYATSTCPCGIAGNWKFNPLNRTYASVTGITTGADYAALLMGDVSGNWTNTGARPANGPERSTAVVAPNVVTSSEKEIVMPISVERASDREIVSYQFDVRYDDSVIQPETNAVDLANTISRGFSVVTSVKEPGLLRVVVYGPLPINDDGILLNLRFRAVGAIGSMSRVTLDNFMFNEGDPRATVTDGRIELSVAAPYAAAEDR